ncbi:hypothetical protein GFY24_38920 [Nocardia sp. SYP-A9097]|uniref:hypothetical protein n=1 Tax=Nocardia sp. SYP-A9097 TaxID=2663237 RepID=UPI00129C0734|nr:hypothetical protein [Nocardia sp. SYP-A9097]MRH93323.1 hypothetical protein [Nocardia sp. SYP-A9097]
MHYNIITIAPAPEPKPDARREIAKDLFVYTAGRLLVEAVKEGFKEGFNAF